MVLQRIIRDPETLCYFPVKQSASAKAIVKKYGWMRNMYKRTRDSVTVDTDSLLNLGDERELTSSNSLTVMEDRIGLLLSAPQSLSLPRKAVLCVKVEFSFWILNIWGWRLQSLSLRNCFLEKLSLMQKSNRKLFLFFRLRIIYLIFVEFFQLFSCLQF